MNTNTHTQVQHIYMITKRHTHTYALNKVPGSGLPAALPAEDGHSGRDRGHGVNKNRTQNTTKNNQSNKQTTHKQVNHLSLSIYIYIYIHTYLCVYIYIYEYVAREIHI